MESSCSVDCGHDETENAEKDWSLSVSTPTSEARPQEHGLGPPEDWVCLNSNTQRDYCQTEEEEGSKQPVVSTHILSLCDSSEEAQSEAEGGVLTVGTLPPGDCGKQTEETDRGEAVIRETQEAAESEDRSEQETEEDTARRREEETESEATDLITPSGDTIVSVMGQSPSLEGSEVSHNSGSEVKEFCQDDEIAREEMKYDQKLCAALCLEERVESEGLTDPLSNLGDLPNPALIDCGDVIEESESAVPCLLIEGLHEGEPPPDANSLEQNQETAGRDYTTEQQWGSAPESRNCTERTTDEELDSENAAEPSGCNLESISFSMDETDESSVINTVDFRTAGNSEEDTRTDPVDYDPPAETMPSSSDEHADLDSGMTLALSSDDDGSFRSVGSSTTDIFHPTQENATTEEQSELAEFNMEQPNNSKPGESSEHSQSTDTAEPGSFSDLTVTDCNQPGTEPEAQLSPSLQTMETLNHEGTEEKLATELPEKDLSLGSALSESGDGQMLKVDQSETGEANDFDPNAEIERSASEVTNRVSCESSPSAAEESEMIGVVEGEAESTETDDKSVVASAEESENVQFALQQHKQDTAEMTADERTPDEGLRHSVDVTSAGAESPLPNNETSSEPHVESEMTENPKTLDAVDGASEGRSSPIQGGQTLIYFSPSSGLSYYHTHT